MFGNGRLDSKSAKKSKIKEIFRSDQNLVSQIVAKKEDDWIHRIKRRSLKAECVGWDFGSGATPCPDQTFPCQRRDICFGNNGMEERKNKDKDVEGQT